MSDRRLSLRRINGPKTPALIADRSLVKEKKAVYLQVANKPHRYLRGKNRIIYIGRTSQGQRRVFTSIAERAEHAFAQHGIRRLEVHILSCKPVQRIDIRAKLERALLMGFREMYGEVPLLNKHGKKMKWKDELEYFRQQAIENAILEYDETKA